MAKTIPFPPALEDWLTTHTDPASIAEALSDNDAFVDHFQALYEARLADLTLEQNAASVAVLRTILDKLEGGFAITDAARDVGFVLGFEYCRRLLTGKDSRVLELVLAAMPRQGER
jgi:hypothetical protein